MSAIEWTDRTWNPVTGCTKVSEGCRNCYAEALFPRFHGLHCARCGAKRDEVAPAWRQLDGKWEHACPDRKLPQEGHYPTRRFVDVRCHEDRLTVPDRWRQPQRVFVNSMSDLFHEDVPADFVFRVWETMERCPQHQFQVLTKRPQRMLDVLGGSSGAGLSAPPLPNVWLGVSAENQATADERIPLLLQAPAAVHWISAEPLLGPIQFWRPDFSDQGHGAGWLQAGNAAGGPVLGWVVAGGESGAKARPMELAWARSIRDQCVAAGVPFLFKQWGAWARPDQLPEETFTRWDARHNAAGNPDLQRTFRFGKKAAGRELDTVTWDQYPEVATQ